MKAAETVLHVGLQQSGAGLLHKALTRLRPQLAERGVAYLGNEALMGLAGYRDWTPASIHAGGTQFEQSLRLARAAIDEAAQRSGSDRPAPSPRLVVSSDHLLGSGNLGAQDEQRFRPLAVPVLTEIIRGLGAKRVQLVLYVHRQDRLMELCYQRELRNGRHHRLEEQFPRCFEPALDYVELIARLQGIPEVVAVSVRPFELIRGGIGLFVNDFLATLGLKDELSLAALKRSWAPMQVYSRRGVELALAMNPHLDDAAEQRCVRTMILENFSTTDELEAQFLSKDVRARILEAYEQSNRRLFETYLPRLPVDSYCSDAATEALPGAALLEQADDDLAEARQSPRLWRRLGNRTSP
jgi:hypothetical protein